MSSGIQTQAYAGIPVTLSFSPSNPWIEIRDHRGSLLFKYDPVRNMIQYQRGSMVYDLIKLDEIRAQAGVVPALPPDPPAAIVTVVTIDKSP
jgi:hypothetical protein